MTENPRDLRTLTVDGIRSAFADEPLTLSVDRLAFLLGQERGSTYRQLRDGMIPATLLGNGRYLIYSKTVRDWLISLHDEGNTHDHAHR